MKRLYILFLFLPLFVYPQAQLSIPFEVKCNGTEGGGSKILYLGLDQNASDTIDIALGEVDLPPYPPDGVFEARFILPKNNFSGSSASFKDFRKATTFPTYTGVMTHRLRMQGKELADTMWFVYNLPTTVKIKIQDILTGTLFNDSCIGQGTMVYTMFANLDKLKLTVTYTNAALPVELVSFNAVSVGKNVQLNWTTATEINNKGFEIERSVNSSNFETIGYVAGSGTTTDFKNYNFTDYNMQSGKYSYRLKQIDYSGAITYSNVVEVNLDFTPKEFSLSQNYPNPFNPATEIKFSVPQAGNVNITVYDMLGSEVKVLFNGDVAAGTHTTMWNGLNSSGMQMSSGTYIYKIRTGEFVDSKKMILMK